MDSQSNSPKDKTIKNVRNIVTGEKMDVSGEKKKAATSI